MKLEDWNNVAIGDHMVFVPTTDATQRTKNRLREHGERGFIVKKKAQRSVLFLGKRVALFESITKSAAGKRTWLGWLVLSELKSIEGDI